MARVLELDLTLVAITPRLWRRLRVPGKMKLIDLHHAIQLVMNWEDRHLHLFEVGDDEYGPEPEEEWEREQWAGDDSQISVAKALSEGDGHVEYVYDFGDEWRIAITVASDSVAVGGSPVECVAGELAAPLEDSGGPLAHTELLEIWKKKGRRGLRKELRDWLPRDYDPIAFDLDAVNHRLRGAFAPAATAANVPLEFPTPEDALQADVTLLALLLGSWQEPDGTRLAWKTLRFETLDLLNEAGLIATTPARKSLVLTEAGIRRAQALRARVAALLATHP